MKRNPTRIRAEKGFQIHADASNSSLMNLFILTGLVLFFSINAYSEPSLSDKMEGLLIGSAIGDAAGGPIEFRPPVRSKDLNQKMSDGLKQKLGSRFKLRPYRRNPSAYGVWTHSASPGSVTDDTRFKMILIQSLKASGKLDSKRLAQELLDYCKTVKSQFSAFCKEWLNEYAMTAKWEIAPFSHGAKPADRLWAGVSSVAGQMALSPIAVLFPGNPKESYLATWSMNWVDTGFSKDLTSAINAGLSAALAPRATGQSALQAMVDTDPFEYQKIPWMKNPRRLTLWVQTIHSIVKNSNGVPLKLFQELERQLNATTWWEGWVPFVVSYSIGELTNYDPLSSMELVLEFGHDVDTDAQFMGALIGALHGKHAFPESIRNRVETRLAQDYSQSIQDWLDTLQATSRDRN